MVLQRLFVKPQNALVCSFSVITGVTSFRPFRNIAPEDIDVTFDHFVLDLENGVPKSENIRRPKRRPIRLSFVIEALGF
jgi:hypothetical protein